MSAAFCRTGFCSSVPPLVLLCGFSWKLTLESTRSQESEQERRRLDQEAREGMEEYMRRIEESEMGSGYRDRGLVLFLNLGHSLVRPILCGFFDFGSGI